MEQLRTVFFLGVLTGILLFLGGFLGGTEGMVIAFVFAALLNGFSYFFSDKIVLFLYRAKPLEKNSAEGKRVHALVERTARKMNIPSPSLFWIEEKSPNAFATGRGPGHAAVVFTRGILVLLNDAELEGVIAHELSHVKNRDVLIASMAATIAGAIGMLARIFAFGGGDDRDNRNALGLLLVAIAVPIIAMLIQLAVSRSREFLADETGAHTLGSGKGLAAALGKLEKGIRAVPFANANQGTAHLFIAHPFSAGGIIGLFASHPPMNERIARLEKMN